MTDAYVLCTVCGMGRDVAGHGDVGPEAARRYLKKHCPAGGSKEVFCVSTNDWKWHLSQVFS